MLWDLMAIDRSLLAHVVGGNLAPIIGLTRDQKAAKSRESAMKERMLFSKLGRSIDNFQQVVRDTSKPDTRQMLPMMMQMMR